MNIKKLFLGGINQDDADFLMDVKEYLGALNARFTTSQDGSVGRVSTIEGNREKLETIDVDGNRVLFTLPAGTNEAIGAIEDANRRRVIWAVWNSNGNHAFYCYDLDDDLVYTVLSNSNVVGGLGFQRSVFIHSMAISDGILYWTANTPRRFNIDSGIKTNHVAYVTDEMSYATPIPAAQIALIRPQPAYPPTVEFVASASSPTQPVGIKAAYRFVYKTGETSTFSTLSPLPTVVTANGLLRFKIPFGQNISQDVDLVELAVRYGDGTYSVVKTWRSTDGAVTLHNSGTTQLSFDFDESQIGAAVDPATAVKPFDAVPITAETLDIAKYRLFVGNILSGYDSPANPPIPTIMGANNIIGGSANIRVLKSGASYKVGIVWYDEFGRYCGVVPIGTTTVPDRDQYTGTPVYNRIEWTLTNATTYIPTWAKYYSIVCTKNKKTDFFFQAAPDEVKYVSKNDADEYVFAGTAPTNIFAMAFKLSSLFKTGYGYTFNQGDVCNVIVGTNVYKLNVIDQYSDYIIVEYNASAFVTSCVLEVYTPAVKTIDVYYEVGNKYLVNNAGTATRSLSTTSGQIDGDVYMKTRALGTIGSFYFEVMNLDDKRWREWYTDHGRPMLESNIKNKVAPLDIRWSNIRGNVINGLSSFDALDVETMPDELGEIKRLILSSKAESEGTVLLAIGLKESASIYIGEAQIFDNKGSSFLAKSSGVIGNVNILRGGYGTMNPESVSRWANQVLYFDARKGCWVRYDSNGLFAISDNKMRKYFKKVGQDIMSYMNDPSGFDNANQGFPLRVISHIDPFHDEWITNTPMMTLIPRNTQLEDMELERRTYAINTELSCGFSIVAEDADACTLIVIAE